MSATMSRKKPRTELANGRVRAAAAREIVRRQNEEERVAFLEKNPALASAFALLDAFGPHRPEVARKLAVLADMERRFRQWRSITDKAVAYAAKLADEVRNPAPPKPEDAHVPAPEGKVVVRGVLISRKTHDSDFGPCLKGTVKVTTPEGTWLAWGTLPKGLWDLWTPDGRPDGARVGDEVELTATLKRGRDAHFALWKRPTCAKIIKRAEPKADAK